MAIKLKFKSSLMASIEKQNMHLHYFQIIKLLTQEVLKKADGSAPKMTGVPEDKGT